MIRRCVVLQILVKRSNKVCLQITRRMSVGVMGEPKLCRSLTKDKLGKPSKVQYNYQYWQGFCEDNLRLCWVKDVEKANAVYIIVKIGGI